MGASESIERYVALGWGLAPLAPKSKAPIGVDWPNRPLRGADAIAYWRRNPDHNVGLIHGASNTCSLDIDNVENFRTILENFGRSYDELVDPSRNVLLLGQSDRAKVLYRAPHTFQPSRRALAWTRADDPSKSEAVFELRAGPVQDVLPPSIHPKTGRPYTWCGRPPEELGELPEWLALIWEQWDRFRPQLDAACPWAPLPRPRVMTARAVPLRGYSVIEDYNAKNPIRATLERYGYRPTRRQRYLSPHSTSGIAGVVVFQDDQGRERAYSHHASDPFDSSHAFDSFDLYRVNEHGGDASAAVRALSADAPVAPEWLSGHDVESARDGDRIWKGLRIVRAFEYLRPSKKEDMLDCLLTVPGVLGDVVDYYNATASKPQPLFAVQTALAIGSILGARKYRTNTRSKTQMFFLCVGKSASGKEHINTTIKAVLRATNATHREGRRGYTGQGAVFSALRRAPAHIAIIDEFGRDLQLTTQANAGKYEAMSQLMSLFGCPSEYKQQQYSNMTLPKKDRDTNEPDFIYHPAVTIMSMSTPETFYSALTSKNVTDGFLSRFLTVESHLPHQAATMCEEAPPPQSVVDWGRFLVYGGCDALLECPDDPYAEPNWVTMRFAPEALALLRAFGEECVAEANDLKDEALNSVLLRLADIASRIALVVSLSLGDHLVRSDAPEIGAEATTWAVTYARWHGWQTIRSLQEQIGENDFDRDCKSVFQTIKNAALKGVTVRDISKFNRRFRALTPKGREDVLRTILADYEVTVVEDAAPGAPGRKTIRYFGPHKPEE